MKINIIDPSSTEFNRGSFCYAPYLCFNGWNEEHQVTLFETFAPEDIDKIKDADLHVITVWSYPQIEAAMMLYQLLPMQVQGKVVFTGYDALLKEYGLTPLVEKEIGYNPMSDPPFIRKAIRDYPKNFLHFKRLLLSDCDLHLKDLDKGTIVFPLFTSYGCPNGCEFCPSTTNCGLSRIALTTEESIEMLTECYDMGIRAIHFTDEDFFYHPQRAYDILKAMGSFDFTFIALGSANMVLRFIKKYGTEVIAEAGLKIIEVGLETIDEELAAAMGEVKGTESVDELAAKQGNYPFTIFWLNLTFFPGETIRSLNLTGEFMSTYGLEMHKVVGRLRTNGTKYGLGQFYQPYHGRGWRKAEREGTLLTQRPIRLIPSYVPNSFTFSKIEKWNWGRFGIATPWLELYNVLDEAVFLLHKESSMSAEDKERRGAPTIHSFVKADRKVMQQKKYIMFAILAKCSVIE